MTKKLDKIEGAVSSLQGILGQSVGSTLYRKADEQVIKRFIRGKERSDDGEPDFDEVLDWVHKTWSRNRLIGGIGLALLISLFGISIILYYFTGAFYFNSFTISLIAIALSLILFTITLFFSWDYSTGTTLISLMTLSTLFEQGNDLRVIRKELIKLRDKVSAEKDGSSHSNKSAGDPDEESKRSG